MIIIIYNSLVTRLMRIKEAWSDIEVSLKRRYDLIPNIVETVKGYATHEKETLEKVTQLRSQAMQSQGLDKIKTENELSKTLKSLFAVAESYPDLKANTNFLQLQQELIDTEDKIQAARRFYNGTVKEYNTSIMTFPSNIIARIFNFKPQDLLEISSEEKESIKVKF
ncbi:MAG: LemA family protein [Minisyncoccia bacterium]